MEEKMCCTCKYSNFQTGDLVTIGYSRDVYMYLRDNLVIHVPANVTIDHPLSSAFGHSIPDWIDILKTNTNDFLKFAYPVAMDRVEYATATEIKDHNATARKDCRVLLSEWIQKSKVNNMEEKRLCTKCKYMSTSYEDEPCKSCGNDKLNWQPKGKFKSGDMVVGKNNISIKTIYIYLRNNWVLRVPNYVLVRSDCDYYLSDYIDKLIHNNAAQWMDSIEYASYEDIEKHDKRARELYKIETLNTWFSQLIGTPTKRSTTDPKTVYKHQDKVFTTPNMIKDVIFRDPATIIFWEDGTKTVVKTQDGEEYDKEKGFAMAVCKKVFGNERDYYNIFKRWMRKGKEVKEK